MPSYCDGMEYRPDLHKALTNILEAWLIPAEFFEKLTVEFEADGYEVVAAEDLRRTVEEVRAVLAPSDEGNDEAEAEAVAAHHGGETVEWPEE